MKFFLEYLKLLFTQWYIYTAFIPELLDRISAYFPDRYHFKIPLFYTWIFLVIAFIYANFQIWRRAKQKGKAPKVIVDYDLSSFNVIYLEIKNIGNDYARNIKTKFDPNIKIKEDKSINDENILKNIPHLAPNNKVRFFFGTFLEKKCLQEFKISISYSDWEEKQKFHDLQIINLSSFIGTSPEKKNEIVEELKNISKRFKNSIDSSKKIIEILKAGISIRNLNLSNLSLDELKILLKNLLESGNKEDLWLYPYISDTRQIIKTFRDKLLAKKDFRKNEKEMLEQLNILHKYQFHLGKNLEFDDAVNKLLKLLK